MMYDDDEACGLHTIDRFACHYNKKAKRFNSKYFQPGTNGVIVFKQGWTYGEKIGYAHLCP